MDPTDIAGINETARGWTPDGRTCFPIQIGQIVVEHDALDALVDIVKTLAKSGRTMLVTDQTPMTRGGQDLKAIVEQQLARALPVDVCPFTHEPGETLHADLENSERLAAELSGYAAVVSVGSGTITDIAKYARYLAMKESSAQLPFICFPTAASVTAYTSGMAVLTIAGCKRTLPAAPPDAIVCDLKTLAEAPHEMTVAGFGDVLARSVASGDWYLAGQLGMDDGFSKVPDRLLEPAEQAMINAAAQVAVGDSIGVRAVTEALLIAGMVMSLVDQTAPISGWEHVISHFLDMTAESEDRTPALHGAQVGVATLIAARAYDRAWPSLDLDRIEADLSDTDITAYRRKIENVFGPHDPGGAMVAEIWGEFRQKMMRWRDQRPARRKFVARKRAGEFDAFLRRAIRPGCEVLEALSAAHAPLRFADLDRPIPAVSAHAALAGGHLIRTRFTLGDLLETSGWLNDDTVRSLLGEEA